MLMRHGFKTFGILGIASALLIAAVVSLTVSGCNSAEGASSDKPLVYASFYPIYDLTKELADDSVEVRSFMPPQKSVHSWEPSPKDMKELAQADLLVVNGARAERWLDKVRQALPDLEILDLSESIELITYKGAAAIGDFQYMAAIPEGSTSMGLEFGHTHEDIMRVLFYNNTKNLKGDDLINQGKKLMEQKGKLVQQKSTTQVEDGVVYGIEMGHESGHVDFTLPSSGNWVFFSDRISEPLLPYTLVTSSNDPLNEEVLLAGSSSSIDQVTYDPHSWLSVKNAKVYANRISEKLIKLAPDSEKDIHKRKVKLVDSLTGLEFEYKDKFDHVKRREFIVGHYAFEYLAREFDLKQYPLQGLISMDSPSLKTMKKAIDYCDAKGIHTVFYEYGQPKKEAETIASEIGGKTAPLASMEYANNQESQEVGGYVGYLRMNLENIYQSLL